MTDDLAIDAFYAALRDDDAQQLYDRAPCGYVSTTPDGLFAKVNQTFLLLTGYERDELIGRRAFADILTVGGRIYYETHYAPMLLMEGSTRGIAFELETASGARLPILVNSVLDRAADGSPRMVRTAIFDATERREYERELLRAKQRAEASETQAKALARTLQQTLIPPAAPEIPGLDVAAVYRPAGSGDEIGGDFYDIFEVGAEDWVIVVGDVCGKGVDAAVITALARYTVRAAAIRLSRPSQVLAFLNEVLLRDVHDETCSVALLRLHKREDGWEVVSSCGGHPLPVLRRAGSDLQEVGRPGTLLGVLAEPLLHDAEVVLAPDDALLLYTDGITEGRRVKEFYGEQRLRASLARNVGSAGSMVDGVLDDVMRFQEGDPRDDIVMVAIRVPT